MNFKNSKGTGAGGTSILMVFVILCMVIFGALSLVSSSSDFKLSQKSKQSSQDYYAADASAQRKIAEIDGILYTLVSDEDVTPSAQTMASALQRVDGVTVTRSGEDLLADFEVPISDGRSLMVRLQVEAHLPDVGDRYRVVRYQTVNTEDWTPGDDINLIY